MKNKNLWEPFQGDTSGDIDLRKMTQINKNNLIFPNNFPNLNLNLLLCKAPTWDLYVKGLCHCTLNAFSSQTLYPWVLFPFLLAKAKIECFHMTSRRPCWCPKPVRWELNSCIDASHVSENTQTSLDRRTHVVVAFCNFRPVTCG